MNLYTFIYFMNKYTFTYFMNFKMLELREESWQWLLVHQVRERKVLFDFKLLFYNILKGNFSFFVSENFILEFFVGLYSERNSTAGRTWRTW